MISPKDLYERVSVSQVSVASSVLSTSAFQRGCVSQTISAFGNDSRRPATAGNVWTMSPREPRRTTKKRGSGMRRLANGIQKFFSRVILGVAHDGHADAKPLGDSTFRHGLDSVVGSFGVNVRAHLFKKSLDVRFAKENDVIHAAQGSDQAGARVFIKDGAARPFEIADARVRIHSDNEKVAFAPRAFEVAN